MKNLCLVLVLFGLLSVLPASAEKIIQNNNADRIVYSRSTCPVHELENFDYSTVYRTNYYPEEKLRVMGNSIKPEFVGKVWYYPKPEEQNNVPKKVVQPGFDMYEMARAGNSQREATDYYTKNLETNKVVPSWADGY